MQIIFAAVYYSVWLYNPCSFLFADDINENPIKNIRSIVIDDENPQFVIKGDALALTKLSNKISALFEKITNKQSTQSILQSNLNNLSLEISDTLTKNTVYREKRIDDYKQEELKSLREEFIEKNKQLEFVKQSYHQNPKTWNLIDLVVANKQVEISNKQLELTRKLLVVQKHIINNYGSFANPTLIHRMHSLEKKRSSYLDEMMVLNTEIGEFRGELHNLWQESYKIRVSKLNFMDFVYFSLITATTTGYGDIIPNNRLVRFVVTFQIVITTNLQPHLFGG